MRIARSIAMGAWMLSAFGVAASAQQVNCTPRVLEGSLSNRRMPNAVGCQFSQVSLVLRRLDMQAKENLVSSTQPEGQIIDQTPLAGDVLAPIVLTVSNGIAPITKTGPTQDPSGPGVPGTKSFPQADLTLSGQLMPYKGTLVPGRTVNFSIQVTNVGSAKATGVLLHAVPTNLINLSASNGCPKFPCLLEDLLPGNTVTVVISAEVEKAGEFNNSVRVSARGSEPNLSNNEIDLDGTAVNPAPDPTTPNTPDPVPLPLVSVPPADLAMTGSLHPNGPYWPGETVEFLFQVKNEGGRVARGVQLNEEPYNLKSQQVSGDCRLLPCRLPALAPESSASFMVTAVIDRGGDFQDSMRAAYKGRDANAQNNNLTLRGYATPLWVWLGAGAGGIGVLGAAFGLGHTIRRARFRSRLSVTPSLKLDKGVGGREPLSFRAPTVQLRASLEPGGATRNSPIPIVSEEVLSD